MEKRIIIRNVADGSQNAIPSPQLNPDTMSRVKSEDALQIMHLAVETNDKQWFDEWAEKYQELKIREQNARNLLGFIGFV